MFNIYLYVNFRKFQLKKRGKGQAPTPTAFATCLTCYSAVIIQRRERGFFIILVRSGRTEVIHV